MEGYAILLWLWGKYPKCEAYMKRCRQLPVVTIFVFCQFVSGCQFATMPRPIEADPSTTQAMTPTQDVTEEPVLDVDSLVDNWLRGVPCRPPCWEGITPGQTTYTQSLSILTNLSITKSIETTEAVSASRANEGTIYWDAQSGIGGSVSYFIDASVYEITVDYQSRVAFREVISAYGEPSHIYAAAYPGSEAAITVYRLDIVYLSQGFSLGWKLANDLKPSFDSEWRDFYVYFFEPTPEGFSLAWGNPQAASELQPWRGMLGFDQYCVGSACN